MNQITKIEPEKKYPPLGMPDFLNQKIKSRLGTLERRKKLSFLDLMYLSIAILAWVFLGIGFFFDIKSLLLIGATLLVIKFLYVFTSREWSLPKKTFDHIDKQLKQRPIFDDESLKKIWTDLEHITIAQKINSICIEQIGWDEGTVFLPNDPFCLMIELYTGDLCEVEAIMAIEEDFFLKFPDEYFNEENPGDLKFKDVVDYIIQSKGEYE